MYQAKIPPAHGKALLSIGHSMLLLHAFNSPCIFTLALASNVPSYVAL